MLKRILYDAEGYTLNGIEVIERLGLPTFLLLYVMFRLEKKIDKIIEAISSLK